MERFVQQNRNRRISQMKRRVAHLQVWQELRIERNESARLMTGPTEMEVVDQDAEPGVIRLTNDGSGLSERSHAQYRKELEDQPNVGSVKAPGQSMEPRRHPPAIGITACHQDILCTYDHGGFDDGLTVVAR